MLRTIRRSWFPAVSKDVITGGMTVSNKVSFVDLG